MFTIALSALESHQWFSPFGFVCIEGQIHSNPFTMYWYVFGLCIFNTFVFEHSKQTQYTPIHQVSSQIQT